jgi:hypothetical protein
MKHLKTERKREPISKTKIIVICVVLGVLAFGGTLLGLLLSRGNLGYEEARNYADEILKTKVEVSEFLDGEVKDIELTDEEKTKFENFEKATDKAASYLGNLSASNALKNKEVNEKYEKAKADFEKLQEVAKTEKALYGLFGSEEIDLSEVEKSDNEFLKKFAKTISDYKEEAKNFVEKYQDVETIDEDVMIEDYGKFQLKGESIIDEYSETSFKDIFGYSKDDVLKFYASIEELVSILNEKI